MRRLLVAVALMTSAAAQAPTGAISSVVTGASAVVLVGARVTIVDQSTSQVREIVV